MKDMLPPSISRVSLFYVRHRSRVLKALYVYLLMLLFASTVSVNLKSKTLAIIAMLKRKKTKAEEKDSGKIQNLGQLLARVSDKAIFKILLAQVATIFCKIYLNMKMITIDSRLVASLFRRRYSRFGSLIAYWLALGVPISALSALLGYLTDTLAKKLSENIQNDLLATYLAYTGSSDDNTNALYKINHLSKSIPDAHQRFSVDVFEFSRNLATLPLLILNPFLDLAVSSNRLFNYDNGGMTEVTLLFGLIVNVSTIFIKLASPGFLRIANSFSELESNFRLVHSNVMHHSEQIAFLRLWDREMYDADLHFFILERFLKRNYRKFALYNFVKTFIIKYTWGALGLSLCAFPVFKDKLQTVREERSSTTVTQDFVQNRSLLMNSSNAMGELLSSKKNVDQISGTSKRIIEFRNALTEVAEGPTKLSYGKVVHNNDMIAFEKVPLMTPAGQILSRPLNLKITKGENLLILGPNGSGKSSLFRMLSGLWPVPEGKLTIPEYNTIFYLPQRPYILKGKTNLIEQIIYPKPYAEFEAELGSNARSVFKELIEILKTLELDFLLRDNVQDDNEGLTFDNLHHIYDTEASDTSDEEGTSYDSMTAVLHMVKDWSLHLSLGSQQRLAMARLYYHRPQFAVLDECTSQVTPEMEQKMYTHATKELNITVLSVAHRTSIWRFHKYLLQFDGKGGYIFKKFDHEKRLRLVEEKMDIEKKLNSVPSLKARLRELQIVKESAASSLTVRG